MYKNKNQNPSVKFKATVIRAIYEKDGFGIYATQVNTRAYPFLKLNQYGNVSIMGDIAPLTIGVEYEITASEEEAKYGYQYRVSNICRDVPVGQEAVRAFLNEILTVNQADELYSKYPDIIERVRKDKLDDIDLSQLRGIGEYTFNKIVEKITKNFHLADIVAEFKGVLTLNMMNKLYDRYGSIQNIKRQLKKAPYTALTNIDGVGFKIANSIILTLQDEGIFDFGFDIKTSVDRCSACIIYLLKENEKEGHTKMNLWDVKKQCEDLVPMCADKFYQALDNNDIYYNIDSAEVAIQSTYIKEAYIAQIIIDNINNINLWECDIKKYKNINEIELTDEQLKVVQNVCMYPISILNGPAGSGKTASTQAIIAMLDDLGKTYKIMSPTGKAAKVISEYTGREATTIHRGLGYGPPTKLNPAGVWYYNDKHKVQEDVVIIDEVSMVDVNLFYRLISAIDFTHTKLLMIGDNAQLPSVGCGNILHDFMQSNLIPTVTLAKIFRYGEGGLMKVATDIRMGKRYLDSSMKDKKSLFGKNGDYVFLDVAPEKSVRIAVEIYKKLIESGCKIEDVQVITPKNVGKYGTVELNKLLQLVANTNAKDKDAMCMTFDNVVYYEGDLIIETKNNYDAPLSPDYPIPSYIFVPDDEEIVPTAFIANGENGIVKNVGKNFIDIAFGDVVVRYDRAMAQMINLGYAITCHKSQGSSINNVILITTQSDIFTLNSNLVYVGCTRARNRCFHIGSVDTMNKVIKKKINLTRHTFMQQLLREYVKNMKTQNTNN